MRGSESPSHSSKGKRRLNKRRSSQQMLFISLHLVVYGMGWHILFFMFVFGFWGKGVSLSLSFIWKKNVPNASSHFDNKFVIGRIPKGTFLLATCGIPYLRKIPHNELVVPKASANSWSFLHTSFLKNIGVFVSFEGLLILIISVISLLISTGNLGVFFVL